MQTKILIIEVVHNANAILLRKIPAGSAPYRQTWYLFGGDFTPGTAPEAATVAIIKQQAGVEVRLNEAITWDQEVKADLDGIVKQFIYLDAHFTFVSGEIKTGPGIERVDWVPIIQLAKYDHVPPSLK